MLRPKRRIFYLIILSLGLLITTGMPHVKSSTTSRNITALAWNVDGSKLALGFNDATVEIWDAATMQLSRSWQIGKIIMALAWNPINDPEHRNILAVGNSMGFIHFYDADTGNVLQVIDCCDVVDSLAWKPDGSLLASGSEVPFGPMTNYYVNTWNPTTGQLQGNVGGSDVGIAALAWSPDSNRIASSARDFEAIIWDAESGRSQVVFQGHTDLVIALAWDPIGAHNRLATGSQDHTTRLWNTETGQQIAVLPSGYATDVAFSPDGQWLAVAWDPVGNL
jgi:WD40 repeat protein